MNEERTIRVTHLESRTTRVPGARRGRDFQAHRDTDADHRMNDFTPTDEQVRSGYACDPIAEYHDPLTNHTRLGEAAFDRWLKAHDARVKAEAIAEAAEVAEGFGIIGGGGDDPYWDGYHTATLKISDQLRATAREQAK